MALFGKDKITPAEIFAYGDAVWPSQRTVEEGWWPTISIGEVDPSIVDKVKWEVILVMLFAVDFAIFIAFEKDESVRDALRDELQLYAEAHFSAVSDEIPNRQAEYGKAFAEHPTDIGMTPSYSIAKRFCQISGLNAEDPVSLLGITSLYSNYLVSVKSFFDEISKSYKVVAR